MQLHLQLFDRLRVNSCVGEERVNKCRMGDMIFDISSAEDPSNEHESCSSGGHGFALHLKCFAAAAPQETVAVVAYKSGVFL